MPRSARAGNAKSMRCPHRNILPIPSRSVAISKSNRARNVWRLQLQHKSEDQWQVDQGAVQGGGVVGSGAGAGAGSVAGAWSQYMLQTWRTTTVIVTSTSPELNHWTLMRNIDRSTDPPIGTAEDDQPGVPDSLYCQPFFISINFILTTGIVNTWKGFKMVLKYFKRENIKIRLWNIHNIF